MIKIDEIETISNDKEGITFKSGETEIFLSWNVINQIAEESEEHYLNEVLGEIRYMSGQKDLN